ncbi:Protein kinase family protein [Frankia canadensis]|uniref:non-specific serine/threonine protein kinase n=1 Tax=Frankia canadensis TaxID=1836972 RepID=A0A2I2KQP3_9ACTN|nr:serine/threonine-protein kinase [Frankia canadensis]SNQ47988.1 Protein kinase family protein [Frankia canadensis]SOU55278.1 Protein kinase family protein [Frankia canadensis]
MAAVPVGNRMVAGRYRLVARLGAGAMGTVWRAFDSVLETEAALKEIEFAGGVADAERADRVERALREARHAAKLRAHPHVVTILDVVLDDGLPWIVMELVPSRSLFEVVRDDGPLPPAEVARVGVAMIDALVSARDHGIVHRDVKPSNVLIGSDGRIVLTDFGIATGDGDPTLTVTGVLGTPLYMAPERLNNHPATFEADLFSLGGTLYYAVEGRPPFERDSFGAMLAAIVLHPPGPTRHAGAIGPVLDGLLEKDPALRMTPDRARDLLEQVALSRGRVGVSRADGLSWRLRFSDPHGRDGTGRTLGPPPPSPRSARDANDVDDADADAETRLSPRAAEQPPPTPPARPAAPAEIPAPPSEHPSAPAAEPAAPAELTATEQDGAVLLRWTPSATPGVSYRVCRVLADPAAPNGRRERSLGITAATELFDAGVPRGVEHWHEVVAVLASDAGRLRSAPARSGPRTLAPTVTALRASMAGDAVELSWRPMAEHDEVVIERTFAETSPLSGAKRRFRGAGGHFLDEDASTSAVYRYRVWVPSPDGNDGSDALAPTGAAEIMVRVVARPRAVLDLEARGTLGGTVLRWTTVPGAVVRIYATSAPTQSGLAGTGPFGPADHEVSAGSLQGRARLVGESRRGRLVDREPEPAVVYTPITVADDRAVIGAAVSHTAV